MDWSAINTIVSGGKAAEISSELDISDVTGSDYRWLHLNWNDEDAKNWLMNDSGMDELICEQLLADETRPRTTIYPDGLLINLRGVNLNENSDPEDMLSVRLFVTDKTVITVIVRKVKAIDDISSELASGDGPVDTRDFICRILELLINRAEPVINKLREDSIDIENLILDDGEIVNRDTVVEIRRVVVNFLRYFIPQKNAVAKLMVSNKFFSHEDKEYLEVSLNSLKRFLEELELINERCYMLNDEIRILTTEKLNRNMYLLSVITAIFLPLGFLTGLFGINLGGIPGAEYKWGFWLFFSLVSVLVLIQLVLLRRNKWF